jgi:hypothetical protein
MANPIMAALSGEEIVHTNALATVTANFVIVPNGARRTQNVIALSSIERLQKVKTTYPGLLVIASAIFLVAAAAYFSKEGSGAHVPALLLGVGFVVAYLVSQRASISFVVGADIISSPSGTLREATALVKAVEKLRSPQGRVRASQTAMSGEVESESASGQTAVLNP